MYLGKLRLNFNHQLTIFSQMYYAWEYRELGVWRYHNVLSKMTIVYIHKQRLWLLIDLHIFHFFK